MRVTRMAVTAVLASAGLIAGAGAASASASPRALPLPGLPVAALAVTFVADRPDDGNGSPDPYWADDTFLRTLTITRTGGTPGHWKFTATLTDEGNFTTIKGAQAPDQGAPYTGDVIKAAVTGSMWGYADFSFTASTLPDTAPNAGVALYENDQGNVPADSTSAWYKLAFPAGTTFGGAGIGAWSWTYYAITWPALQQWTDAWDNGYGDVAADGNITG